MKAGLSVEDLDKYSNAEVFAFGSNLDPTDFRAWCKRERELNPVMIPRFRAALRGYRLCWNYYSPVRRGGAANICRDDRAVVIGMVFEVDPVTLSALDMKEGHPERYRRVRVSVESIDSPGVIREVWTYQVTAAYRRDLPVMPTQEYLEIVLRGIAVQGLPEWWRDEVIASVDGRSL